MPEMLLYHELQRLRSTRRVASDLIVTAALAIGLVGSIKRNGLIVSALLVSSSLAVP